MSKLDMKCIYRIKYFRSLISVSVALLFCLIAIDDGYGKIINKCPKSREQVCQKGGRILSSMANNMDEAETDFYLWDAKPSSLTKGFWHLSFTDSVIMDQRAIIYTDGNHVIPIIMPVVPGRDFSGDDENLDKKSDAYKNAMKKEALRRETSTAEARPAPVNRIPIEQIGMFLGPIDVKGMLDSGQAFTLLKGRKKYGTIILVDNLMTDRVAEFLDDFKNKKKKWQRYKDASVVFVPYFGFMGDRHSAFLGKYFYAMIEADVPPLKAIYNLSRLTTGSKINKGLLREYCNRLVGKEKKPLFNRVALETPSQTVFAKSQAALKLGVMQPSYYIINGQYQMWE